MIWHCYALNWWVGWGTFAYSEHLTDLKINPVFVCMCMIICLPGLCLVFLQCGGFPFSTLVTWRQPWVWRSAFLVSLALSVVTQSDMLQHSVIHTPLSIPNAHWVSVGCLKCPACGKGILFLWSQYNIIHLHCLCIGSVAECNKIKTCCLCWGCF